jgi:hypothetical protein
MSRKEAIQRAAEAGMELHLDGDDLKQRRSKFAKLLGIGDNMPHPSASNLPINPAGTQVVGGMPPPETLFPGDQMAPNLPVYGQSQGMDPAMMGMNPNMGGMDPSMGMGYPNMSQMPPNMMMGQQPQMPPNMMMGQQPQMPPNMMMGQQPQMPPNMMMGQMGGAMRYPQSYAYPQQMGGAYGHHRGGYDPRFFHSGARDQ